MSAREMQNSHLEAYRQLHETVRFLGTEQSLMAIALLSFNGLAIFQAARYPALGLAALMVLVGLFGVAHNNRLAARYDRAIAQLREVASVLQIEPAIGEGGQGRPVFAQMRAWFYILYGSLAAYWIYQLIQIAYRVY